MGFNLSTFKPSASSLQKANQAYNLFGSPVSASSAQLKPASTIRPVTGGTTLGPSTVAPSTSGQSIGGGSGGTGGVGTSGSGVGLTTPTQPTYEDMLRNAFDSAKSSLESIIPTYDADFQNYSTGVNNSIDQASKARDTQVGDLNYRYGDALKQALQTSRDLRGRTQSTFSGLGTLDSSSYGDELLKQQQQDVNNQASLSKQQNSDISNVNNTFDTFKNDQTSKIAAYQSEIDRAKAGIRQAIANNDISQAQALSQYAQNLQNTMSNFALQLASAQSAGTNVIGNLQKINGSDFLKQFGQLLSGQYNNGLSKYQIPGQSNTGAGYIGSSNGMSDEQRRLLGLA